MVSCTVNLYPVLLACIAAVFAVGGTLMVRPTISDRAADRIALWFFVMSAIAAQVAVVVALFPVGSA